MHSDPEKEDEIIKRERIRQEMHIYTCNPLTDTSIKINAKFLKRFRNPVKEMIIRCKSPYKFHRFRIFSIRSYSREYIFRSMLLSIYPAEITPLKYKAHDSIGYFFARNCADAIAKFIENKLLIPHFMKECPFSVDIVANFCDAESLDVDDTELLIYQLNNRFIVESNTLLLDRMSKEDVFPEYYPLYQQSTLTYILEQSSRFYSLEKLSLRDNYIKHIKDLSPLKLLHIKSLDLSNNEISSIDDLEGLKDLEFLIDLNLQFNPIIRKYDSHTYNYAIDVKSVCKSLQTLDGVDVSSPSFKRNFICSTDAHELCEKFIEHYFTLYDSKNRQHIMGLYDNQAILAVSAGVIQNQRNSENIRLEYYGLTSPYLLIGSKNIKKFLYGLGRICHDPYSFVCDLTVYTSRSAVLTVGGLFRESNQILGFSRTFVLKAVGEQYCITNEQLLVYNALDYQLSWGFCFPRKNVSTGDLLPFYRQQYLEIDHYIQAVTGLNLESARRILKICKYDAEKALIYFSELFINNKLTEDAFCRQSKINGVIERPFYDEMKEKALEKFDFVDESTIWSMLNEERLKNTEPHILGDNRLKKDKIRLKPILDRWHAQLKEMPADPGLSDESSSMQDTSSCNSEPYSLTHLAQQFTLARQPINLIPLMPWLQQIKPALGKMLPPSVISNQPFQQQTKQAPQVEIVASASVSNTMKTTTLDSKKMPQSKKSKKRKNKKAKNKIFAYSSTETDGIL